MTNKKILEKAIEKAIRNGFVIDALDYAFIKETYLTHLAQAHNSWCVIFDHDFAKAFFGEQAVCDNCGVDLEKGCDCTNWLGQGAWMFHLQRMVLEDEPIKYLEKFL